MRIALFGPVHPFRGGIAHYTTLLQRTLLDEGHTVLLVSFSRMYPRALFPGESDRDTSTTPLHAIDPLYEIDSLNPLTWLATFVRLRRFQPDLIVFPWWTPFFAPLWYVLGLLNRLFLRARLAILCHNVLPHEKGRFSQPVARLVLGWADRLVVQSDGEKSRLSRILPGADVKIAPHPVYDMWAEQRISRTDARARLALPQNIPILLFFGIVRKYKGLEILLESLPGVQAAVGELLLVVAGEFWEDAESYRQTIRRLGVADFVRIDNRYIPDEEAALYFSAADLLVAPYTSVTGSGVIQMAAGFGLPVVTTALFDPALHHPASRRVAVDDVPQLVGAVADALTDIGGNRWVAQPDTGSDDSQASWRGLIRTLIGKEV